MNKSIRQSKNILKYFLKRDGLMKRISVLLAGIILSINLAACSSGVKNRVKDEEPKESIDIVAIDTKTISESIVKSNKKTIAVVDFTDLQGHITELGRFLAEELSVEFTNSAQNFKVIDRLHLKSLLSEHKLSMAGLIDPKTVKKLGEIAGVDAIITGSITPFGDSIRITIKVIATDTAEMIVATKTDIAKTKAIEELRMKGIETENAIEAGEVAQIPSVQLTQPVKAQQKMEEKNFLFEVQNVEISGQTMIFDLLITNKDSKDRELEIYGRYGASNMGWGPTRMFDDLGNEYFVKERQIGNVRASDTQGGFAKNLLISEVPAKARLIFEGVSSKASNITVLEIGCNDFIVKFHNISIKR